MATIALPRPIAAHQSPSPIGSLPSTINLGAINSNQHGQCPPPVPNKHLPICPPGPVPQTEPTTAPLSPGSGHDSPPQSLLYPPDKYPRLDSGPFSLYMLETSDVAAALDHRSRQPLPDPAHVFPWLHGLHPNNHVQLAFFVAKRRALRRIPSCLRGVTIVKADGDLSASRLKGAISPDEFLQPGASPEFIDIDPKEGFSVRNFQIQTVKAATTSDIVVYGDDHLLVRKLGWDVAAAQRGWREKHENQGHPLPHYNTFICVTPFAVFEEACPEIVAVDSTGHLTGDVVDFFHQERMEMYTMTRASEVSHNVWIGPTPDPTSDDEPHYDLLIECSDLGRLNPSALQAVAESDDEVPKQRYFDFPSSGSILAPSWSQSEADGILETCKWIYHLAHGTHPSDSRTEGPDEEREIPMPDATDPTRSRPRRKILIHCADGYTESTMLGIAYFSYSTGLPIPEAWLTLHTTKRRNFFAYTTDVALLTAIGPRLLHESPVCAQKSFSEITALIRDQPKWFSALDGSFPSRITDYMYLGNLTHANNPSLLKALGIGQILSVGETAMWPDGEVEEWGADNVRVVQGVQDNGIDPLTEEFERCLDFIDQGRHKGTATLVHCRVGVSRSATICIAEVMRSRNMSFPRAYCFVRARRLNVIIQPHLRFAYELLKWEERLQTGKSAASDGRVPGIKRELEWSEIAREVALMNRPYAR